MNFDNLIICITNYDFNENSEHLKRFFSGVVKTVLIDSSSPNRPVNADVVIANNYYPGLWNQAVECAVESNAKWMLFVASDVIVHDPMVLLKYLNRAIYRSDIGVYTPSLDVNSRCAYSECKFSATAELRDVPFIEGFFFLSRTSLIKKIYPIPASNYYGWGVDANLCHVARSCGLRVVVDDRVSIYHPPRRAEHSIDDIAAARQAKDYLNSDLRIWMANNYRFSS